MKYLVKGLVLYFLCSMLIGAYMMIVYWLGSALWFEKAKGSLIRSGGEIRGSYLLGQEFTDPKFFKARPKEVINNQCNLQFYLFPLKEAIEKKITGNSKNIKYAEMLTSSASGLDPYISLEAALMQISDVAIGSGISEIELEKLVRANTLYASPPFFEMDIVNITKLNSAIIFYSAQ